MMKSKGKQSEKKVPGAKQSVVDKSKAWKNKQKNTVKNETSENRTKLNKKEKIKQMQKSESNSSMEIDNLLEIEHGTVVDENLHKIGEMADTNEVLQKKTKKMNANDGKKKPAKVKFTNSGDGKSTNQDIASNKKSDLKRKRSEDGQDAESMKSKKAKLDAATFKDRRKSRKMQNKNYEIGAKAKSLWENLRRADLPTEKRQEICTELYETVKDQAQVLIFAHDTSRVIQSLIKFGSQQQKDAIFEEVKDHIRDIIMSNYAYFFVKKIFKYGSQEQKDYVFEKLSGHYVKLLRHKVAGKVIEMIYNDYANAAKRHAILMEFYGKMFKAYQAPETEKFEAVLKANTTKHDMILDEFKKSVKILAQKEAAFEHTLVHHIFYEFFTFADSERVTDLIPDVRERLLLLIPTRDGARVAMTCLWNGTAKDRKVVVKTFKTFVTKICTGEHSYMVMLSLFDVVDDTKLVQKAILDELIKSIDELAKNEYGRKVLLYLLAPRDHLHFHPDVISILQKGDGNTNSKKEPETRREELRQYVSPALFQWIADNCHDIVQNSGQLVLLSAIIKHAKGDPTAAMKAVSEMANKPFVAGDEEFHIIDHTAGHLTLKHLITDDAQRISSGENVLFSKILLDTVSKENLLTWLTSNRGCFIIVSMFEKAAPDVVTCLAGLLKDAKPILQQQKFVGAQVLLKKLKQ